MNGATYLNCLKEYLIPFIKEHHKDKEILFWPDMATCHHKKEVTEWMAANNINFVSKKSNAPCVPQARGIEMFWSLCKSEYKKRNKQVKTIAQMTKIWSEISKKVAENSAQKLMATARRNLRLIQLDGVYAPFE